MALEILPGHPFDQPVSTVPGIGPARAASLVRLNIHRVRHLLLHLPRNYADRRTVTPMDQVRKGDRVTVSGEVVKTRLVRLRGRMTLAEVTVSDGTAQLKATWFGRGFLAKTFEQGRQVILSGPVGAYNGLALQNPDYELLEEDDGGLHTGRIVPLYRLTDTISQRMLRQWIRSALDTLGANLDETLPDNLLSRHGFPGIAKALGAVHFPKFMEEAEEARKRFAYEELFALQQKVLGQRIRAAGASTGYAHTVDGPRLTAFRETLPFALTAAQENAIADILGDMAAPQPMARLVQGDVGCGKTVVALHALLAAADGGYQTAFMAPTELLAEQHVLTLRRQLAPLGIEIGLLTGSAPDAARLRGRIADGAVPVVVGTQALIQDSTSFQRLGLVIIDEQHRFGVEQRERLRAKSSAAPDILHMTATPIPRTMAITAYGAMDLTLIDELPPGRLPVKTRYISEGKMNGLYRYLVEQAPQGFQAYIICPLVEESETRALRAVVTHYEALSAGPLSALRTALLHGRLPFSEKEAIMSQFAEGSIDVLFSTTVIEVGVDVPRATTIVIEDAGQFGLTQLHQLRGRVGRGPQQSHCFLAGKPKTADGKRRIDILCQTVSGFDIAQADLELRGPGEIHGVRQAGVSDLRAADLLRDADLLEDARRDAREFLQCGLEGGSHSLHARISTA